MQICWFFHDKTFRKDRWLVIMAKLQWFQMKCKWSAGSIPVHFILLSWRNECGIGRPLTLFSWRPLVRFPVFPFELAWARGKPIPHRGCTGYWPGARNVACVDCLRTRAGIRWEIDTHATFTNLPIRRGATDDWLLWPNCSDFRWNVSGLLVQFRRISFFYQKCLLFANESDFHLKITWQKSLNKTPSYVSLTR